MGKQPAVPGTRRGSVSSVGTAESSLEFRWAKREQALSDQPIHHLIHRGGPVIASYIRQLRQYGFALWEGAQHLRFRDDNDDASEMSEDEDELLRRRCRAQAMAEEVARESRFRAFHGRFAAAAALVERLVEQRQGQWLYAFEDEESYLEDALSKQLESIPWKLPEAPEVEAVLLEGTSLRRTWTPSFLKRPTRPALYKPTLRQREVISPDSELAYLMQARARRMGGTTRLARVEVCYHPSAANQQPQPPQGSTHSIPSEILAKRLSLPSAMPATKPAEKLVVKPASPIARRARRTSIIDIAPVSSVLIHETKPLPVPAPRDARGVRSTELGSSQLSESDRRVRAQVREAVEALTRILLSQTHTDDLVQAVGSGQGHSEADARIAEGVACQMVLQELLLWIMHSEVGVLSRENNIPATHVLAGLSRSLFSLEQRVLSELANGVPPELDQLDSIGFRRGIFRLKTVPRSVVRYLHWVVVAACLAGQRAVEDPADHWSKALVDCGSYCTVDDSEGVVEEAFRRKPPKPSVRTEVRGSVEPLVAPGFERVRVEQPQVHLVVAGRLSGAPAPQAKTPRHPVLAPSHPQRPPSAASASTVGKDEDVSPWHRGMRTRPPRAERPQSAASETSTQGLLFTQEPILRTVPRLRQSEVVQRLQRGPKRTSRHPRVKREMLPPTKGPRNPWDTRQALLSAQLAAERRPLAPPPIRPSPRALSGTEPLWRLLSATYRAKE
jgi:hypothetical protein